jgi:hypothetical protein
MNRIGLCVVLFSGSLLAQPAAPTLRWWQKEPLRICDIVTSMDRIDGVPPAELAEWKASRGFNAEHLEIMGMEGGLDDQDSTSRVKLPAASTATIWASTSKRPTSAASA